MAPASSAARWQVVADCPLMRAGLHGAASRARQQGEVGLPAMRRVQAFPADLTGQLDALTDLIHWWRGAGPAPRCVVLTDLPASFVHGTLQAHLPLSLRRNVTRFTLKVLPSRTTVDALCQVLRGSGLSRYITPGYGLHPLLPPELHALRQFLAAGGGGHGADPLCLRRAMGRLGVTSERRLRLWNWAAYRARWLRNSSVRLLFPRDRYPHNPKGVN